jgi:hypothetical protein
VVAGSIQRADSAAWAVAAYLIRAVSPRGLLRTFVMPSRRRQKYGELPLPLVVAVNVDSEHCDDIDINNALFGNEVIQFVRTPDGSCDSGVDTLACPMGFWFDKKGARNQYVSAVLIGCKIDPYKSGVITPQFWFCPPTVCLVSPIEENIDNP